MSEVALRVGNVLLRLRAPSIQIAAPVRPPYRDFVVDDEPNGADISITWTRRRRSPPAVETLLFDSGGAWSIYRQGAEFLIAGPQAVRRAESAWTLRVDEGFSRGELWLDPAWGHANSSRRRVAYPLTYPADQVLLVNHLATRRGALVHACVAPVGEAVILCAGPSGAGKSTLARILRQEGRSSLLSDDRVIVRELAGEWRCFGTPWPGDAGVASPHGGSLGALCFLRHASRNVVRRLTPKEAAVRLLRVTAIPWYEPRLAEKLTAFLEDLVLQTPAYDLYFAPDRHVVATLEALL